VSLKVLFGRRLKVLRAKGGLTQEQLAAAVGVEARTIRRWESGDDGPFFDHLEKLSIVLGEPAQSLFDFTKLPDDP